MSSKFLSVLAPHIKAASQVLASLPSEADQDRARIAMTGAIVQAWYGFDTASLQEIATRNSMLNHQIGFERFDVPVSEYERIQSKFLQDGTLKRALQALLDDIEKVEPKSQIIRSAASKVGDWINRCCPRNVFFCQYSKSPLTRITCDFLCESHGELAPEVNFLAAVRDVFPVRDIEVYEGSDEGLRAWNEEHPIYKHFSEDRTHYVSCYSKEVSLIRRKPYDNWHPTQRYIEHIAAACQKLTPETKVDVVKFFFVNNLEVPNVFDYFYLFPDLLKPPAAPTLMRQMSRGYELPNRFRNCWHNMTFQFADGDPRSLDVSLVVHDKKDHFWVELAFEARWRQPAAWTEIPAISNKLKDSIYVAFHSLLKEKARQLIS